MLKRKALYGFITDRYRFLLLLLGGLVAVFGLGLLIYGLTAGLRRAGTVTRRVETFVAPESLAADDPRRRPIIPREVQGSLLSRTLGDGLKKFLNLLGRLAPRKPWPTSWTTS
jgi:hypothetical protein